MNEVLKNIEKRRSIRVFRKKPIDENILLSILAAANNAPSAHNKQSWIFNVIKHKKKKELIDLINKKRNEYQRPISTLLRMASRSISSAPVVISVSNTGELIEHGGKTFKSDNIEDINDFFRTMEIQSSAAAVENLLLAAKSFGIGSVWLGILYIIKKDILRFLNLSPQGEFMAIIPIGYPLKKGSDIKKKSLELKVEYTE